MFSVSDLRSLRLTLDVIELLAKHEVVLIKASGVVTAGKIFQPPQTS